MYPGRLAIQQRVLPAYRVGFFDTLARMCARGLGVFAGQPLPHEGIAVAGSLADAFLEPAHNRNFRDPSSALYLCLQDGITRWLEAFQPDVLVVEANSRLLSTRLALAWMHRRGRPVLGWGLGAPRAEGLAGRLRSVERAAFLKSLDGWIAYSRRGAEEYRQLGLNPERIYTAGNAVLPRPDSPLPDRPAPGAGPAQVLFVGRLQRRKRIDLLLQACAQLPADLQPRLVIVGDGPERGEMEAQAQAWYPQAEFLGAKYGDALCQVFLASDLFVLPGTGGLAIQQAMGHALPVIAAQGDGTQEDLVRAENGWLLPPGELQPLVNSLQDALSDLGRLRQMGLESFQVVCQEANLEHMAGVFIQAAVDVSQPLPAH